MGLFDCFKTGAESARENDAPAAQTDWAAVLLEIAAIISDSDAAVWKEMTLCTSNPKEYFSAHQERYEERGVDDVRDLESIQWLGLVDILEAHNYVCERDWKDEKEDFLYFLGGLNGRKRLGLELREDWFSEEDDISIWSRILDEKWEPQQCCLACIDINSDSYVLFPCGLAEAEQLKTLAAQLGRCIVGPMEE